MKTSSLALLSTLSVLALTGCQSAPPNTSVAPDATMPAVPATPVEAGPLSEDEKVNQLDARVSALEGQMQQVRPALQKVEAMDHHFRALSLELDRIESTITPVADAVNAASATSAATPVAPAMTKQESAIGKPAGLKEPAEMKRPEVAAKPPKAEAKAKETPSSSAAPAVTSVRFGDQKGTGTRIVLDTTQPAELHYDLDNSENVLVVDLPNNAWKANTGATLKYSPLIKSFEGTSDEKGAHLVIQLKKEAKVSATARLKPGGGYGHRVYLDLVPAK